jgi:ATP-dependent DNA helicase RecG
MLHPTVRAAGGDLPSALTPIYPTVAGLPQAYLRKAVLGGLARAELSDTFAPGDLRPLHPHSREGLWTLHEALAFLHHPRPDVAIETLMDHSHPAWQRLKAEELLAQQLSQLQARRARAALRAPVLLPDASPKALRQRLHAALPFTLTGAQTRVSEEIALDMARHTPMHRLLQGDVGAGKTVVAALAAAVCIDAGWQCAR